MCWIGSAMGELIYWGELSSDLMLKTRCDSDWREMQGRIMIITNGSEAYMGP